MGAYVNILATVPPPRCVSTGQLHTPRRRPVGIVANELFTRLALNYAQLRDELRQLELNPYSSSVERADLVYRMRRVRARMASVPIYVK
jgi:hypothetical protein